MIHRVALSKLVSIIASSRRGSNTALLLHFTRLDAAASSPSLGSAFCARLCLGARAARLSRPRLLSSRSSGSLSILRSANSFFRSDWSLQLAHEPTAPAFTSGRHQHQRPAAQLAAVIDHRMQPELLLEALRLQLGQTAESDDAKLRIVQPGYRAISAAFSAAFSSLFSSLFLRSSPKT